MVNVIEIERCPSYTNDLGNEMNSKNLQNFKNNLYSI